MDLFGFQVDYFVMLTAEASTVHDSTGISQISYLRLAHVRDKMNTEIDFYANVLTVLRIFISLQFDTVMSRVTDK